MAMHTLDEYRAHVLERTGIPLDVHIKGRPPRQFLAGMLPEAEHTTLFRINLSHVRELEDIDHHLPPHLNSDLPSWQTRQAILIIVNRRPIDVLQEWTATEILPSSTRKHIDEWPCNRLLHAGIATAMRRVRTMLAHIVLRVDDLLAEQLYAAVHHRQ